MRVSWPHLKKEASYLFIYKFAILRYMKLIIGLGNPGPECDGTRHNIGFYLTDYLAGQFEATFTNRPKFKAESAEFESGNQKVHLIKPQTFYNLSGQTVRAYKDFYKIENADILVIHDELALPFGTIRSRRGGSDAGNNGIKNISLQIDENYYRLRVGIWNDLRIRTEDADFVLQKFSKKEQINLANIAEHAQTVVKLFIKGKLTPDTTAALNPKQ